MPRTTTKGFLRDRLCRRELAHIYPALGQCSTAQKPKKRTKKDGRRGKTWREKRDCVYLALVDGIVGSALLRHGVGQETRKSTKSKEGGRLCTREAKALQFDAKCAV